MQVYLKYHKAFNKYGENGAFLPLLGTFKNIKKRGVFASQNYKNHTLKRLETIKVTIT